MEASWKKETLTSSARHLDVNISLFISHRHPGKLHLPTPILPGTELRGGMAELLSQTRTKQRTFPAIILYNSI